MITKERVSRWIMYFGVLAAGGALMSGSPASLLVALLLVGQYAALQAYHGYHGAEA